MAYLSMGDLASSDFNSTKYPGTCKPSNVTALGTFKRLQKQMGRVAYAKGYGSIAIDGDIGPGTVAMLAKIKSGLAAGAWPYIRAAGSTCIEVASKADGLANAISQYAGELGAPATVPTPAPAKPPTIVDQAGLERPAPVGPAADLLGALAGMSTIEKVAGVAILGGIGYFLIAKRKA